MSLKKKQLKTKEEYREEFISYLNDLYQIRVDYSDNIFDEQFILSFKKEFTKTFGRFNPVDNHFGLAEISYLLEQMKTKFIRFENHHNFMLYNILKHHKVTLNTSNCTIDSNEECEICNENQDKMIVLTCKHKICRSCLSSSFKNNFNKCPFCRSKLTFKYSIKYDTEKFIDRLPYELYGLIIEEYDELMSKITPGFKEPWVNYFGFLQIIFDRIGFDFQVTRKRSKSYFDVVNILKKNGLDEKGNLLEVVQIT